jgi:hypothetical protein
MAQTIAAQRGTATVTSNGTTANTLFTQSTGTATRVILNSSAVKHGETQLDRMSLCINVNGTGNYACVALKGVSNTGNSSYGINMMPSSSYTPLTTTMTGSSSYVDRWIQHAVNTNHYLGSTVANDRWSFAGPNGVSQTGGNVSVDYVPSQFWLNSGDSLVLFHFCSAGGTSDCVYSFTTITES